MDVTPSDVAALRALVGARVPRSARPHVEEATLDTIRAFARGAGDDNPLFGDPAYAARSARGGLIAPPLFPIATGSERPGSHAPIVWPTGLRDRHVRVVEDRWAFGPAVRLGTRLDHREVIAAVDTSAPDRVEITSRTTYAAHGVVHATHERVRAYELRVPAAPRREKHRWTDAEIAAIEREVLAWVRRGATPRPGPTVREGDVIGPLVKGPLTLTDLVAYRAGVGAGPFDVEPLELAVRNRLRRPGFYDRTDTNAWDARERLHWDEAYARACGHPTAYDYSHTRLVWTSQLLTDWMGDAGRLAAITFARHADNYVGDAHRITATVERVVREGAEVLVHVTHRSVNQLGAVTASGTAVVGLPLGP